MHPTPPPTLRCKECGAIVRELVTAERADRHDIRRRLEQVAGASGRDDEMKVLLDAHSPGSETKAARARGSNRPLGAGARLVVLLVRPTPRHWRVNAISERR
jgi:hypothetical protein